MSVRIRYQEYGGILMCPDTGAAVPAIRDDGVLVLISYGRDLVDLHGAEARPYQEIPPDRVLCELPGVEMWSWTRLCPQHRIRVVVPGPDVDALRAKLASYNLLLGLIHRDEVNGGAIWAGVTECLARHRGANDNEWTRDAIAAGHVMARGFGDGLTSDEVAGWVRRIMNPYYHASDLQTSSALQGLLKIGCVTCASVDGERRYKIGPPLDGDTS